MAFSLDSKVKDILKNPAAAAVLDKYSPDASKNPQMKLVGGLTLRKLASFPQSAFLQAPSGGAGQGASGDRVITQAKKEPDHRLLFVCCMKGKQYGSEKPVWI